ncbi:O-antigen ligase family protein [uncultured Polaribacter sp.]|uniref:O-antigen ligase family protein n=1 Tax=uncultured Polaribacter sp. TaxID=174711 RepID=UPI002602BFD6|nr:O-antigen ligase family protein [uncultured Polaribacter sp.]
MKIGISKTSSTLLLLSLPLNIIVIAGIGNVYLSTVMVMLQFMIMLFLSNGKLVKGRITYIVSEVFLLTLVVTIINIILNGELINTQITKTVIYLQNTLAIIMMSFFVKDLRPDYFYKTFLVIVIMCVIRVYIEEPSHFFKLSVLWDERIESEFVAGVNTFAMLNGLAFVISFFYLKQKFLKLFLSLFFILIIVLTMSRGALLAAIATLFITAFYDLNRETFNLLVKYSFIALIIGVFVLIFSGKIDAVMDLINERFFSFFYGEKSFNDFFAGRGDLIQHVTSKIYNSSIFQFLFGHGNGSMKFVIPETGQKFETSHLVPLDILYRNGIILTLLYINLLVKIFQKFIKNRTKENNVLFGLFVFFHLELLVNPMIFSAQSGWVYSLFLILFLKQNDLNYKKIKE